MSKDWVVYQPYYLVYYVKAEDEEGALEAAQSEINFDLAYIDGFDSFAREM